MSNKLKNLTGIIGGGLVGFICGFFGGGGGMLGVPLLTLNGLDTKRAHASAIAVILPVCAVSAVIYIINGFFSLYVFIPACIGVILGGALGAAALKRLSDTAVALMFALMMIAVGIRLMV